jgi:site-specific DNA-cytosine methylase
VDTSESLKVISICTGLGGLDLGANHGFGGRTQQICACERESYAIAVLQARMSDGRFPSAPIYTELETFPFESFRSVPELALFGGFPCQPFSVSGLRKATDDHRYLWDYIEQGIQKSKPTLCLWENVDGIASAKHHGRDETSVLKHVLGSMESMGYVTEATSVSAREVGAGHNRRRWFILGVLADPDNFAGLRICRHVAGLQGATSQVQGEGSEPTEEVGCRGTRPCEFGDFAREFPARPKQPQKPWEFSRVLADPTSQQDGGDDERGLRRLSDGEGDGEEGSDSVQAQSSLGESIDGVGRGLGDPTSFVGAEYTGKKLDYLMKYRPRALRLLGNAVVPQQASRAVRILATRIAQREL